MKLKKLILNIVLGICSVFVRLRPIQKDKIAFVSLESKELESDLKLIHDALEGHGYRLVSVLTSFEKNSLWMNFLYFLNTIRQIFVINTSALVIISDNNYVISRFKRKGVKVLQVWHAAGAIKKFGRQALAVPGGRDRDIAEQMGMHKNYDCVLCASRRTAEIYAEAFGVTKDKLRVIGVPRVDAILKMDRSRCRRRFYAAYPELRSRKTVLYAPTFREGTMPDLAPMLRAAEAANVNLIVRLHPLDRERLKKHPEVPAFLECEKFGTFTLMAAADAVVTDYSAISIEASLIKKPVYFYVYDLEDYAASRGLNFDPLVEMPHCASKDFGVLLEKILHEPYDFEKLEAFRAQFVETNDRHNVDRIVNLVLRYMSKGVTAHARRACGPCAALADAADRCAEE